MHLSEYTKATEINVAFIFAISMLSPVLAPYIKSLGFDNIQLSLIFAVMPLMIIFSSPVIGRISDNIGRKNVIVAGMLAEIVAICLYMFGTGSAAIIIARMIDAVAATAVSMAALAKIEDCVRNEARGRYAGASLSIEYIGRLAGPVIGGLLADRLFVQAPFLAAILILAGLILFIPKKKIARKDIRKKELDLKGAVKTFLSYRELRGMAILGIVMHATFPAHMIFLPLLITESMGLSYAYVGYAFFALGATHILQFMFGRWSDRKAYRVVLAGTFISGIFLALLSQAAAYPVLLAILFLKGIGNSMWNISAWTLMSNIGERAKTEGEIIGTYISIAKVGSLLSFIASGFVVEFFGISTLFMLNGALIIIGTIIAYPLMRK